jgi:hypothetical protein
MVEKLVDPLAEPDGRESFAYGKPNESLLRVVGEPRDLESEGHATRSRRARIHSPDCPYSQPPQRGRNRNACGVSRTTIRASARVFQAERDNT